METKHSIGGKAGAAVPGLLGSPGDYDPYAAPNVQMDTKHTPEPWQMDGFRIIDAQGNGIARQTGEASDIEYANKARAVACVNALAGLNPAAVPGLVKILETICRDACECELLDGPSAVDGIAWDDILAARAALAAAKGE